MISKSCACTFFSTIVFLFGLLLALFAIENCEWIQEDEYVCFYEYFDPNLQALIESCKPKVSIFRQLCNPPSSMNLTSNYTFQITKSSLSKSRDISLDISTITMSLSSAPLFWRNVVKDANKLCDTDFPLHDNHILRDLKFIKCISPHCAIMFRQQGQHYRYDFSIQIQYYNWYGGRDNAFRITLGKHVWFTERKLQEWEEKDRCLLRIAKETLDLKLDLHVKEIEERKILLGRWKRDANECPEHCRAWSFW